MPKVRVWTTQIQVLGSWWRNWFFTFCTKIPPFLTLEFPKMALSKSAFFRPKCPYIKGFEWFVRPQNSRIPSFSSRCPEYARNEEISNNTLSKIRLSLLLRFSILHLDSEIQTVKAQYLQFRNVNQRNYNDIWNWIFKYANIKLLIRQLIFIIIRRFFCGFKHLKISYLYNICL